MKASTERKLIRWLHLLASIPILGYIYGPVAQMPEAVFAIRVFLLAAVILSGLWLWKGQALKKWIYNKWGNAFESRQKRT